MCWETDRDDGRITAHQTTCPPDLVMSELYRVLRGPFSERIGKGLSEIRFCRSRVGAAGWGRRLACLALRPRRLGEVIEATRILESLDAHAIRRGEVTHLFIEHDLRGRRARRIGRAVERLPSAIASGDATPLIPPSR
ncbi:hypothetical protein [Miltoncostaea oceani]|uniref:hypothetical protein n=1 Tax=Miltoncostaea oceani TaxID=2843216 RepID=UPI001C3E6414|nr:hypothetical protein [Miltoncostaea oceani]